MVPITRPIPEREFLEREKFKETFLESEVTIVQREMILEREMLSLKRNFLREYIITSRERCYHFSGRYNS